MRGHPLLPTVLLFLLLLSPTVGAGTSSSQSDAIRDRILQRSLKLPTARARADALTALAEDWAASGRPARARRALEAAAEAAREAEGADQGLYLKVGRSALRCGLPDVARTVLPDTPRDAEWAEFVGRVARAFRDAGKRPAALGVLEEARGLAADAGPGLRVALLAGAGPIYARAERPEAANRALEEAERLAAEADQADRAELLGRTARAAAEAGRVQKARQILERISEPARRVSQTLALAGTLASSDRPEAAAELADEAARTAEPLGAELRYSLFSEGAELALEQHQRALAERLAGLAERAAEAVPSPSERARLLQRVGELYARLERWRDAERVAQGRGGSFARTRYRAHRAVEHLENGQVEQAWAIFQSLDAQKAQYVGHELTRDLGRIYRAMQPEATLAEVRGFEPERLRSGIIRAYAHHFAREGEHEKAVRWAATIEFRLTRDSLLREIVTQTLHRTDPAEARAALAGLDGAPQAMRSANARREVTFALGVMALKTGDTEGVRRAVRRLREMLEDGDYDGGQHLLRANLAALLQALGEGSEARRRTRKAIRLVQDQICAGCREEGLRRIFEELSPCPDFELLRHGLDLIQTPQMRFELPARILDERASLSPEQQRYLLVRAAKGAAATANPVKRADRLLRVAAAYRRLGLSPAPAVLQALEEAPEGPPLAQEGPADRARRSSQPAHLLYFTRSGCAECREAKETIDRVLEETPRVHLHEQPIDTEEGLAMNEAIGAGLKLPEHKRRIAPAVFSMQGALVGEELTADALKELIAGARAMPNPAEMYARQQRRALERGQAHTHVQRLSFLIVAGAGLVDGINPCAFTVIIFFLAYLSYLGKNKGEIVTAGITFTAAVFVTYFAIGLGLRGLLAVGEERWDAFADAIYVLSAAVVLVAAVLALRDAVRCLRGHEGQMTLSLPKRLRGKIRRMVSERARLGLTIGTTVVLGGLVALFEFPCTGQIYTPIIVAIREFPELRWGAAGWLLLYNLFFILPLVGVFVLVLFGLTSEALTRVFRRHLATAKFAMATVFIGLFAFMVVQFV
ncbi:MAG: hypothetical protein ACOC7T_05355 [Planctomycetota bacterium]